MFTVNSLRDNEIPKLLSKQRKHGQIKRPPKNILNSALIKWLRQIVIIAHYEMNVANDYPVISFVYYSIFMGKIKWKLQSERRR